jgi:hypothetical protein
MFLTMIHKTIFYDFTYCFLSSTIQFVIYERSRRYIQDDKKVQRQSKLVWLARSTVYLESFEQS